MLTFLILKLKLKLKFIFKFANIFQCFILEPAYLLKWSTQKDKESKTKWQPYKPAVGWGGGGGAPEAGKVLNSIHMMNSDA